MDLSERSVIGRILSREGFAGEDIRHLRLGRSANTVVVETDRHVVRVAWSAPMRADIEARVWAAARAAGVPAPEPHGHGRVGSHDYMVYRRLTGWPAPSGAPALRHAGTLLAALHAAPPGEFPQELHARPRRMRRFALASQFVTGLGDRLPRWTGACLRLAEQDWAAASDIPTHGDFRGVNLLARGDQICGVLDWSDARRASREADLGGIDRTGLGPVLDGYLSVASSPRGALVLGYAAARYGALARCGVIDPDAAATAIEHCARTLHAKKIVIDTGGTDQSC